MRTVLAALCLLVAGVTLAQDDTAQFKRYAAWVKFAEEERARIGGVTDPGQKTTTITVFLRNFRTSKPPAPADCATFDKNYAEGVESDARQAQSLAEALLRKDQAAIERIRGTLEPPFDGVPTIEEAAQRRGLPPLGFKINTGSVMAQGLKVPEAPKADRLDYLEWVRQSEQRRLQARSATGSRRISVAREWRTFLVQRQPPVDPAFAAAHRHYAQATRMDVDYLIAYGTAEVNRDEKQLTRLRVRWSPQEQAVQQALSAIRREARSVGKATNF